MNDSSHIDMTRIAYDTVAASYADLLRGELADKAVDRHMLASFADMVQTRPTHLVADIGCGPGRITTHLHSLGLDAFGIDLSPGMITVAQRDHPDLRFEVGSMLALDLEGGEVDGIVSWYSIIHTPPTLLHAVFTEMNRVLSPGGFILLAFQVGDECVRLEQAYGHSVSYDVYRLPPDRIVEHLSNAGFSLITRIVREPTGHEKTPQAYLIVSK